MDRSVVRIAPSIKSRGPRSLFGSPHRLDRHPDVIWISLTSLRHLDRSVVVLFAPSFGSLRSRLDRPGSPRCLDRSVDWIAPSFGLLCRLDRSVVVRSAPSFGSPSHLNRSQCCSPHWGVFDGRFALVLNVPVWSDQHVETITPLASGNFDVCYPVVWIALSFKSHRHLDLSVV